MSTILSALIVLPIAAAIATYFTGRTQGDNAARWIALISSLVIFLLSLTLLLDFDTANTGFQFVEKAPWFVGYDINYHVGIDGISLWMVLLTTFYVQQNF